MNVKKVMGTSLAMALMLTSLAACGDGSAAESTTAATTATTAANTTTAATTISDLSGSVTGSGSSALLPLAQDAAEAFKAQYPDISITLNAGGSGTGLKQVSDGSVDIGNSDVAAEEKLDADQAAELVDHKVAVVTMAAIVNNELSDSVKDLTKQQLIDIFTGKITNWSEVGGPDQAVLLVTRPDTSGTRALFTQYALDGNQESADASYLETDNSGELLETVKSNPGAIGYLALSYLVNNQDVSTVAIDGVEPTLENTYNGSYPVWGYEHMYTKGEPSETVKAFIDFILSDSYASQIEAQGYGVTAKMTVSR
ncbi:MAG: phosphate ABC transporter substrate-binding protein [Oscillospiraceae bacterium]|nr:phosphate ABC transporter substrate-binding protein [Oscillospiraceae bacterium]MDD4368842.1 phosphate ABC transporter substrate-binding protein [Oscillospiraceae bacterium]